MSKEIILANAPIALPDADLIELADKIVRDVESGRQELYASINRIIIQTYWKVGHDIVEYEQQGKARAKYGSAMLTRLSHLLRGRLGRGYSRPNLNNMRKFYLLYPNCQISDKFAPSSIIHSSGSVMAGHDRRSGIKLFKCGGDLNKDSKAI